MIKENLSRDEVKQIGIAVLIAGLGALAGGLIQWGLEELKENVKKRREKEDKPTT